MQLLNGGKQSALTRKATQKRGALLFFQLVQKSNEKLLEIYPKLDDPTAPGDKAAGPIQLILEFLFFFFFFSFPPAHLINF